MLSVPKVAKSVEEGAQNPKENELPTYLLLADSAANLAGINSKFLIEFTLNVILVTMPKCLIILGRNHC